MIAVHCPTFPLTLTPAYHYHHRYSCGMRLYFVVGLNYGAENLHRKDPAPAILKESEKERV